MLSESTTEPLFCFRLSLDLGQTMIAWLRRQLAGLGKEGT